MGKGGGEGRKEGGGGGQQISLGSFAKAYTGTQLCMQKGKNIYEDTGRGFLH